MKLNLKKQPFKTYVFLAIFLLIVSFLVELFIFNFKPLFIYKNDTIDVTDKLKIRSNSYLINLNKNYVNKLFINYNASDNVKVKIICKDNNGYNKYVSSQFEDTFNKVQHRMIINLNKKIKTIKISSDLLEKVSIKNIYADSEIHINLYRIIFIFLVLNLLFLSFIFYKKKVIGEKLYILYFLISVIFGSFIIIFQPASTFASWDDQIHYMNSYNLFGNRIEWHSGDVLMYSDDFNRLKAINSIEENNDFNDYVDSQTKVDHYDDRDVSYGKIGYVFFGFILFLGRFFNLPFSFYFKFAKIFNLIIYSFGMSYIIKKAKVGKNILFGISLIPTAVFLSSEYSYDHFVTLGLLISSVQLINLFADDDCKVDFTWMLIFLIGIISSCFIKAIYIFFILLFLFVPNKKFVNNKQMIKLKLLIFIIFLLILSTFVLPTITGSFSADYRGGDTSVSKQLALILKFPFTFMIVLKNSMIDEFISKFFGIYTIGSFAYLGNISNNCYYIYIIYLVFLFFTDYSKDKLSNKIKIVMLVIVLLTIALIWTALYLSFTPVGELSIGGVQGRYFIPIMYTFFLSIKPTFNKIKYSNFAYLCIVIIPIIILSFSIYSLLLVPFCL